MKTFKEHIYGDVKAFEMGFSPIGKPAMTVRFYYIENTLIDAGQSYMRKEALGVIKNLPLDRVLLTHHHEDHSGNIAAVKEMKKIPGYCNPLTIEKMGVSFNIRFYQHLFWGVADPVELEPFPESMNFGSILFEPIHTPGHSKDHTVYYVRDRGWLFSGDLFLGPKIKYFRADEKMKDSIDSLEKIMTYDFDTIFCSHNPQLKDGKKALKMKLEYLKTFYGTVAELHKKGISFREILQRIPYKEVHLVKAITFGNVSMANMVKASINDAALNI